MIIVSIMQFLCSLFFIIITDLYYHFNVYFDDYYSSSYHFPTETQGSSNKINLNGHLMVQNIEKESIRDKTESS